jgi:hypothetical protein
MAADLARDQLAAELSGADNDDVKALGFLAFDLAAAAGMVGIRTDLDRYWFFTVIGLGVSACLLIAALWRRTYKTGPNPREFYREAGQAADPEEVALLAMAAILAARATNEEIRRRKAQWYTASLVALIVTAVGSSLYLWLVH